MGVVVLRDFIHKYSGDGMIPWLSSPEINVGVPRRRNTLAVDCQRWRWRKAASCATVHDSKSHCAVPMTSRQALDLDLSGKRIQQMSSRHGREETVILSYSRTFSGCDEALELQTAQH